MNERSEGRAEPRPKPKAMVFHLGLRNKVLGAVLLSSICFTSSLTAAPKDTINELMEAVSRDSSLRDSTVHSLVSLMKNNPSSPDVPRAFAWLIHNAGATAASDYDKSEAFFKRIEAHHADNTQLAGAITAMIGFREPETIAFLERLGDNSKSDVVAGTALVALASSFEFDKKAVDRYELALNKIIKNYPDLKYGDHEITTYAKHKLYASENLRVGNVVPEIEGEDATDTSFKLSDYRGKIVFLKFWGDW